MSHRTRAAAVLLAVAAALALPVLSAGPAAAHAELVLVTPANEQAFGRSRPSRVQLSFTEAVGIGLGSVRLLGSDGREVRLGRPEHPAGDGTTVQVALPALPADTYTVAWRVVSTDTHVVQGASTFTVGTGRPRAAAARAAVARAEAGSTVTAAVYGAFRWLALAGLALLAGVGYFVTACWPDGRRSRAVRRTLWGAWGVSVLAALGTGLSFGPQAAGAGPGGVLDPSLLAGTLSGREGSALLTRSVLLALLVPVLRGLPSRPAPGAGERIAVLGVAAVLAATWSVATHGAVGPGAWLALPADVVHLVAMATWLGGLAALAFLLLPSADPAALRVAVPAFSRVALASVAALAVTGTYAAWRQLGTTAALTGTPYGQLLLVKLAAVAVLVALGAAARSWVERHYAQRPVPARQLAARHWVAPAGGTEPPPPAVRVFRRRVLAELAIGFLVLGLSSVLASTEPGRAVQDRVEAGPPAAPGPSLPPGLLRFDTGGPGGQGQLAVDVAPAKVGVAVLHLSVLEPSGRPKAVPGLEVSMQLPSRGIGPVPVRLGNAGPGHYASVMNIPLPGRWDVVVTVRTSDLDSTTIRTSLEVVP